MEKVPGLFTENTFPTKAQMRFNDKAEEIKAVSNHFSVIPDTKDFVFIEWHVSFINQTEVGSYEQQPTQVRADAIPPDSRQLIFEVLKANKKSLYDKIGKNFSTGVTLYSLH